MSSVNQLSASLVLLSACHSAAANDGPDTYGDFLPTQIRSNNPGLMRWITAVSMVTRSGLRRSIFRRTTALRAAALMP